MKKRVQRLSSLFLCCCLLLGGLPPSVSAERALPARSPGAAAALSGSESALLRMEDLLFRLAERLRLWLACFDGTGAPPADGVPFPKALVKAKTLLLTEPPRGDEALALGSLQGLLANASETQLLFKDAAYRQYGGPGEDVIYEERTGERATAAALLKEFASFSRGYVLCDETGAQAAVSVAGVLRAVVIPESLRPAAEEAGLACLEDVRGWTDRTLRRSRYFCRLNKTVAFSQPVSMAPKLVDYAVMAGAYFGCSDSASEWDCRRMYAFLDDNAVVFGWNPALGEYGTVSALSTLNACLIPADHSFNLSVLSGFSPMPLRQKAADAVPLAEAGHTVCLYMSDGDNLQWIMTGFADAAHFGSPLRGAFPMGWGVPASLSTAAPSIGAWLYGSATPKDEFILQLSGLGYTFPSRWRNPFALRRMFGALSAAMAEEDLRIAAVLDDHGFARRSLDALAEQESVDGVFYIDFADYAGMGGAMRLSGGKPLISAKYKLWANQSGGSPEEIAAAVNASCKDPSDPSAYSLIVVHAWSGLDADGCFTESGDTMAAVNRMVAAFDGDVRIVPPTQFVKMAAQTMQ